MATKSAIVKSANPQPVFFLGIVSVNEDKGEIY